jgi:hypothetical protein
MAREYDWFNSQPVILANFLAGDDTPDHHACGSSIAATVVNAAEVWSG